MCGFSLRRSIFRCCIQYALWYFPCRVWIRRPPSWRLLLFGKCKFAPLAWNGIYMCTRVVITQVEHLRWFQVSCTNSLANGPQSFENSICSWGSFATWDPLDILVALENQSTSPSPHQIGLVSCQSDQRLFRHFGNLADKPFWIPVLDSLQEVRLLLSLGWPVSEICKKKFHSL